MRRFAAAVLFGLFAVAAGSARAQSIQELDPLSFGSFLVQSNATVSTLTVALDGPPLASGSIIILASGAPGRYRIGGLAGNTTLTISITASPLLGPGLVSQYFELAAFDHPPTVITNALGQATFRVGATLSTSGTNVPYTEGSYTGTIDIMIATP